MANSEESVKVFIRVRPPDVGDGYGDRNISLEVDPGAKRLTMLCQPDPKVFTFDDIANIDASQELIFNMIGKKVVENCVGGYNGTIFAYGQTGSGKTFTMIGSSDNVDNFYHNQRGIIPRSFEYLFALIQKKCYSNPNIEFLCKCSFLEIYNEQIYDLLDTACNGLHLRESIKHGVFVEGLTEMAVDSAAGAYQVLCSGWKNRTVAATSMNRESSRSHAIFSIYVESKETQDGVINIRASQLNLVDLAGSERQKDTLAAGVRLKEAGNINRSLSTLSNVIMALVDIDQGKARHVSYRDSKLTFLLKDSLGGNSKTCIVACIHPGARCFPESLSTLQFARRAKLIKNKAVVNEDVHGSVLHLQAEVKKLKEQLALFQNEEIVADHVADGDGGRWKTYFTDAMMLREKELHKQLILKEEVRKHQELSARKEQALQQMKMLIKLREEALKRLEKAMKEKGQVNLDDKDFLIESLRSENRTLLSYIDRHPDIAKYTVELDAMKHECQQLRIENASLKTKRTEELEKLYLELKESSELNSPAAVQTNELMNAVERHLSQIAKLQDELESYKKESCEEREKLQRCIRDLEIEITAQKRAREEAEKLLNAHRIKMQIERETREDMHLETLRLMTTPKKSRTPSISESCDSLKKFREAKSPAGLCDPLKKSKEARSPVNEVNFTSPSSPSEMLIDINEPACLMEESFSALTDQIQKLQEENRTLRIQFDARDAEILSLVENAARIESQKIAVEQQLASDTLSWSERMKDLQQKLLAQTSEFETIKKQFSKMDVEKNALSGEVTDLRIVLNSTEKRLIEAKADYVDLKETSQRIRADLETKIMKLEHNMTELSDQLVSSQQEVQRLQDQEESMSATLNFREQRLTELQEELTKKLRDTDIERNEFHITINNLQSERDELLARLNADDEKDKQWLKSMEEYRIQVQQAEEKAKLSEKQIVDMQAMLHACLCEKDQLVKADAEKKESLAKLMSIVSEQRDELRTKQLLVEELKGELAECHQQSAKFEEALNTAETKLCAEETAVEEMKQRHLWELEKKVAELEMLQDDHTDLLSQNDKLLEELRQLTWTNESLLTEQKTMQDRLADSNRKLATSAQELEECRDRLERAAHRNTEVAQLGVELEQKNERLAQLLRQFDIVCEQLNTSRSDKCDLEKKLAESQLEYDRLKKLLHNYEEALHEGTSLKEEVERKEITINQLSIDCEVLRQEKATLEQECHHLQKSLNEALEEGARLAGHQNLKQKIHYVEDLKKKITELNEEINRLRLHNAAKC